MQEMHLIIQGDVQGVGFRAMVLRQAQQMNLTGTVANLADGSVEIYAQGPQEKLQLLYEELKFRSKRGRVEQVFVEYYTPQTVYQTFNIIGSR